MENEYSRLQRDLSVREEELNRERERFIEASELSKAAWSKEKESLNTQLAASKTEQDRLAAQYQELVVTVKKARLGIRFGRKMLTHKTCSCAVDIRSDWKRPTPLDKIPRSV